MGWKLSLFELNGLRSHCQPNAQYPCHSIIFLIRAHPWCVGMLGRVKDVAKRREKERERRGEGRESNVLLHLLRETAFSRVLTKVGLDQRLPLIRGKTKNLIHGYL